MLKLFTNSQEEKRLTTEIRLAIAFKDFALWLSTSCVGLNVAGHATAKVLNQNGIRTTVFPVRHNVDLVNDIDKYNEHHGHSLTHVAISAPWLSVYDLEQILIAYPDIKFAVLSHSNVGFLQADADGVRLLRRYIELAKQYDNLQVGGNSRKFADWLRAAYGYKPVLLPNLYPICGLTEKPWQYGTIKIGAFGAVRPYKNFITAAGAAVALQRSINVPVEFHMSTGGESGNTRAIEQIFEGTQVTLIKHEWTLWNHFIKLIGDMDVMMQPSFTESFNMITADGISVGVPSVVSDAINWAPEDWKADSDDALSVMRVARTLLTDDRVRNQGFFALNDHNIFGLEHWRRFVGVERKKSFFERVTELF